MIVERQDNEILVRIKTNNNISKIQNILDYLRYEELTDSSISDENETEKLLSDIKKGRWDREKTKLGINE